MIISDTFIAIFFPVIFLRTKLYIHIPNCMKKIDNYKISKFKTFLTRTFRIKNVSTLSWHCPRIILATKLLWKKFILLVITNSNECKGIVDHKFL